MSFRLPSVIVYQELLSTTVSPSTPYMDLCVVGPVYQCASLAEMSGYSLNTSEKDKKTGKQVYKREYPDLKAGADVDLDSVSLTLTNVSVKVWPSNDAAKNIVEVDNTGKATVIKSRLGTTGTQALEDEAAGIRKENTTLGYSADIFDLIWIDPTTEKQVIKSGAISDIEDGTPSDTRKKFILAKNIRIPEGVDVYATVRRDVEGTYTSKSNVEEDLTIAAEDVDEYAAYGTKCDEDYIYISVGALKIATTEDNEGKTTIVSCDVAATYRALRLDCANDFITISSYADAVAQFGNPNINNPMSIAAQVINSAVGAIKYKVLPISSDDLVGYNLAIDRLSNEEDIYVVEPLSTDKQIIDVFVSHCKAMSAAEKSKWRVIYGNMPIPATKTLIQYNAGTLTTAGADTQDSKTSKVPREQLSDEELEEGFEPESVAVCYLKDEDSNGGGFITNGVRPTDYIEVGVTNKTTGLYTVKYYLMVKSVESDNSCICYTQKYYFDEQAKSFMKVDLNYFKETTIDATARANEDVRKRPAYTQGQIAYGVTSFPTGKALYCISGGTVAQTEPAWPNVDEPDKVVDGDVIWKILDKPAAIGSRSDIYNLPKFRINNIALGATDFPDDYVLVCLQGGTVDAEEPKWKELLESTYITDGTVQWKLVKKAVAIPSRTVTAMEERSSYTYENLPVFAEGEYSKGHTGFPEGYAIVCRVAGQVGTTEPTWPTSVGEQVVDGGVTWELVTEHEALPFYYTSNLALGPASNTHLANKVLLCTQGGYVNASESAVAWPTDTVLSDIVKDGSVTWKMIDKPNNVLAVPEFEAGRYQKFGDFAFSEESEDNPYPDMTNCTYQVKRALIDTGELADAIAGVAESYKTKRFRYVQPDQIMITVNGSSYLVGSEYLCVALGAMRAGFPPHQGFSTMGISGIDEIIGSNKKFSEEQLTDMASRGVFLVAQNGTAELPYVLYQTTTDNGQLEVAEDSCVAVVDYASKYYKKNLKSVLGRYNVNTISMNYVKTVINACSNDMTSTSYEYIGPMLTSATIVSLVAEGDKIKPTIKIGIPYPVNGVDITLQV